SPWLTPILFELGTLKRREVVWSTAGHMHPLTSPSAHVRSSLDGKGVGIWTTAQSPTGVHWVQWDNQLGKRFYSHTTSGHVVPGPGGRLLFTGAGLFTSIGFPTANKAYPGSEADGRYLPAHHSDYYLHLGPGPTYARKVPPKAFAIYKQG